MQRAVSAMRLDSRKTSLCARCRHRPERSLRRASKEYLRIARVVPVLWPLFVIGSLPGSVSSVALSIDTWPPTGRGRAAAPTNSARPEPCCPRLPRASVDGSSVNISTELEPEAPATNTTRSALKCEQRGGRASGILQGMAAQKTDREKAQRTIAENRKARHDYPHSRHLGSRHRPSRHRE